MTTLTILGRILSPVKWDNSLTVINNPYRVVVVVRIQQESPCEACPVVHDTQTIMSAEIAVGSV